MRHVWVGVAVLLAWLGVAHAKAHPDQQGKPCAACHDDAHHGELARRPDGGACASCHTTAGWVPSTFGAAQHASTGYPLDGKHVATPCSGCHPGARPRTSFLVAGKDCLDCHVNPHGQQFAARQARGGCADCHTTFAWKQWKVDHRTWPLAGGHARAACTACHPGKTIDSPPASLRGVARECTACHVERHAQQFARAPKRTCTDCHTAEAWSAGFDHKTARYALEGVHVQLACARCHPETELRNGEKVVAWRLGYAGCRDCHADPHAKAGKPSAVDCNACHAPTTWRAIDGGGGAGFDHDTTGFVLRAAHAKAKCTQCHDGKPKRPELGERTNSTCQRCHPDPHMGRMAGQCYECHSAVAWQDTAMFEQHRRTRMPLTGRHAVLDCGACHKRQSERPFRDLPTDCFGCHADDYAATLHVSKGFPRTCAQCHVTTAWKPAIAPSATLRQAAERRDHGRVFEIATGSHRDAACDGCHVDRARTTRAVRCDGCHAADALRTQHPRTSVAPSVATTCLRCHPRGARR